MSYRMTKTYIPVTCFVLVCFFVIILLSMSHKQVRVLADGLPAVAHGYRWQNIFDDEFNGSSLNANNWVTCYEWYSITYNGCSNTGNLEKEWYMPEQVTVSNGSAQLEAISSPTSGLNNTQRAITYPYRSGMISTGRLYENSEPKSAYLYGYFVARIKVPSGKGLWPAFWLTPADHSWPPEIDVMEILGDQPNDVIMTYHWGVASNPQKDYSLFNDLPDPNDWHTYAVNWQPGRIDWYIDGVLRKSVNSSNVPSKPMEVIANLAVGGNVPGEPNNATQFPATMDVDYIRVYKEVKL